MPKKESKDKILDKLVEFLNKHHSLLLCEIKDLPANNIHKIRKEGRETNSEILCGKTVKLFLNERLLSLMDFLNILKTVKLLNITMSKS